MSDRIAWQTYEGEAIETLVAIFLLRLHPHGERRKPSTGDKGIDILVRQKDGTWDVYQVKRYTSRLDAKQKASITESWTRLRDYTLERKIQVSNWIVVRPRDATTEDTEWLEGLTSDSGVPSQWLGETNLDAWATQFPEAVDYYLKGGEQRAFDMAMQLFQAVKLSHDAADGIALNHSEARDGLEAIYKSVNAVDPHFRYEFAVGAPRKDPLADVPKDPDLAATFDVTRGTVRVRTNIYRRYNLAEEDSPLDLELNIALRPHTDAQAQSVAAFQGFGAPLANMPAEVTGGFPGVNLSDGLAAEVTAVPVEAGRDGGDYELTVTSASGDRLTDRVVMDRMNGGERGWSWTGIIDGTVSFTVYGSFDGEENGLSLSPFTVQGMRPRSAELALQLQRALSQSGEFSIAVAGGPPVIAMTATADSTDQERDAALAKSIAAMHALTLIQQSTPAVIRVPTPDELQPGEVQSWLRAGELLQKGHRSTAWDHLDFTVDTAEAFPPMPIELMAVTRAVARVAGKPYSYGHVVQRCVAVTSHPLENGQTRLEPGPDNRVIERMTTEASELALVGRVLARPAALLPVRDISS